MYQDEVWLCVRIKIVLKSVPYIKRGNPGQFFRWVPKESFEMKIMPVKELSITGAELFSVLGEAADKIFGIFSTVRSFRGKFFS